MAPQNFDSPDSYCSVAYSAYLARFPASMLKSARGRVMEFAWSLEGYWRRRFLQRRARGH